MPGVLVSHTQHLSTGLAFARGEPLCSLAYGRDTSSYPPSETRTSSPFRGPEGEVPGQADRCSGAGEVRPPCRLCTRGFPLATRLDGSTGGGGLSLPRYPDNLCQPYSSPWWGSALRFGEGSGNCPAASAERGIMPSLHPRHAHTHPTPSARPLRPAPGCAVLGAWPRLGREAAPRAPGWENRPSRSAALTSLPRRGPDPGPAERPSPAQLRAADAARAPRAPAPTCPAERLRAATAPPPPELRTRKGRGRRGGAAGGASPSRRGGLPAGVGTLRTLGSPGRCGRLGKHLRGVRRWRLSC